MQKKNVSPATSMGTLPHRQSKLKEMLQLWKVLYPYFLGLSSEVIFFSCKIYFKSKFCLNITFWNYRQIGICIRHGTTFPLSQFYPRRHGVISEVKQAAEMEFVINFRKYKYNFVRCIGFRRIDSGKCMVTRDPSTWSPSKFRRQ